MNILKQFVNDVLGTPETPQKSPMPELVPLPESALQELHEHGLLLAYASETGFIDEVAEATEQDMQALGLPTLLMELNDVDADALDNRSVMLFMTSTTGSGDSPFAADQFWQHIMSENRDLSHLHFGLLCAGDSDYDTFCGFGHELRDWLLANGAHPLFTPVDVDCEDADAISLWQKRTVGTFNGMGIK